MGGEASRQNGKKGGRPKGASDYRVREKEEARAALRQIVLREMEALVGAQIANAKGLAHFMQRDPKTGKFERVTDPEAIVEALNADAEEGSRYYIFTKDPSVQAFTDLMNRALDKPKEQEQEVKHSGSLKIIHEVPE